MERESIAHIRVKFKQAKLQELPALVEEYQTDERAGVAALVGAALNRLEALKREMKRTEEMKRYERETEHLGFVCGIDEVGRGPLAGPVMAGAVILPKDCRLLYLNDSKQLSEKKREELYAAIMEEAVAVGIGSVSPERIDEINILQATYEAMREAVGGLTVRPGVLLVDAVTIPGVDIEQLSIVKGDAKSISIAAASIVAKVTRDRLMAELDSLYPEYGFADNKGYGSKAHIDALRTYGPSPIHRRSFITHFVTGENSQDIPDGPTPS